MKRIFLTIVALACLGLGFFTPKAEALNLPECVLTDCNCSDFATQPEAQAVFDVFVEDFFKLDKDGDGRVCTSLPGSPKTAKVKSGVSEPPQPKSSSELVLEQIKFGNPSDADSSDLNNYLIPKEQFVISYNCSRNLANWVSWMVNASYIGDVERADNFRPDPDVPCYKVTPRDYTKSGYDRGHIAPSADRDSNKEDNSATFFMSNMMPQSPSNNREVWRELETYERDLITELGNEAVYIVAGPLGSVGTLRNSVVIPESTWKVILIVADGSPNRTIAVDIPNNESVKHTSWRDYLTTVDRIEKLTGYDFFQELPDEIEEAIESQVYQ